jgi:putative ABC transport system permease protein
LVIRPRWKKAVSDIAGNLVRSLLVILSIAVGLFAVGIISSLHSIIQADMRVGYTRVRPANIQFNFAWFDQELVDRIGRMEGVERAEGALNTNLRLNTGQMEWIPVSVKASRDFEKMQLNQVEVKAGIWPPGKDEIVIDQYKFSDIHANLGDELEFELPSGKTRKLRLVGITKDQTIGAGNLGGGFFLSPVQGYIDHETLARLDLPDRFNTLYITVSDGGIDMDTIWDTAERVRKEVENNGYLVYNLVRRLSIDHPNITYVDAISGVLFLLGFLVVFLSGFLITNTFTALLNQQVNQIGIMKTVGANRTQIMLVYMMVILIFGVLACALSVPLSYWASTALINFLADKINIYVQSNRMVPESVALQVVIALLVPQFAGFFPILRGARIPVQAAISGISPVGESGKKKISSASIGKRSQNAFRRFRRAPRYLVIAIKNVFRQKRRLLLTLLTLSLGGAVFIATFNVRSSLQDYINQVVKYFRADVNLTLTRAYRVERIQEEVMQIAGVAYIEPWIQTRADVLSDGQTVEETVSLLAPPAGSSLVEPIMLSGRWLVTGDQNAIALSERFLARFPEIGIGDTIRLRINGREGDYQVVGFFQLAGKSGGMVAYANYDYLSEFMRIQERSDSYRIVSNRPNLTLEEQKELGQMIENHLREKGYQVREIEAGSSLQNSTSRGLDILTTFLLIMAGLTALVGSIGLTGTMSLNVMERTREIGVLRAIGASDGILFLMVMVEGMVIGVISWGLGSLFAFPISRSLSDVINNAVFDAPANFTWTMDGFALWLGLVIVLSAVAALLPARNATRLTIREVLAYE